MTPPANRLLSAVLQLCVAGLVGVLLLTSSAVANAQALDIASDSRPRIALVLSGGGARGGAHLGVLKVLQEMKVPVDMIVGTSAGSIIGAAYASGMPLSEIEAELRPLNTSLLFRDVARRDLPVRRKADDEQNFVGPELGIGPGGISLPKGAVAGVSLEAVLRRLTVRQVSPDFDRLPIPFRAVATDLTTAEMVVLDSGSLSTAVRASMALPAIVTPVEIDGRLLVDGGVSRNLPVDVARAMGADVIIAINIGTPLQERRELTSLLSVSEQMVRILTVKNVAQSLRELTPQDVLITPNLGTVATADFDRLFEAADAGEVAARAAAAQLRRYSVDSDTYAALEQQRATTRLGAVRIDEVRVTGARLVNPDTIRDAMDTRAGQTFDAAVADADMKRLYGRGDFEGLSYSLSDGPDGSHILTTDVTEKSWGPNYLRFGLGLSSDFSGNSYFNLLVNHRRTWLNSLGAEWRNDLQIGRTDRLRTEFYQPLDAGQHFFAAANAETRRDPFDLYINGERFARYRRQESTAGVDLGVALGNTTELRVGVTRGRVSLATDTGFIPGNLLVPPSDIGGLNARLRFDTLDNLRFPRSGVAADLRYFQSQPGLGADQRYGKLDLSMQAAVSSGPNTLRGAVFATRSVGSGDLPLYEVSQLGGFLRLSGYSTGELLGTDVQFGRLVYARRISAPGLLDGVEVGLSAEVGRVALQGLGSQGTLRSNALFMGVDTPVGPLYLGYGRATGGRNAIYLYLGLP